ncbi:MAG: TonB-dependent receptor [Bacteroidetes bacterium]|nr:TonB-dependent receptor [Bacteroidota bacterium]
MILLFAGANPFGEVPVDDRSEVLGTVIDSETNEPVHFAYVHLEEINRAITADRNGEFQFQNVPQGNYTLYVHRIGFRDYRQKIEVGDESISLNIFMQSISVQGEEVTITGDAEPTAGSRLEHASTKVLGEELRRNLGTTLSETLQNKAGISERSSGPAPGRPVIRGLGDERVLILQDGERTGDVSAQSADHAVSIDPMGAEEIEIARGPAALAYGANAIGGVINVVRNQIPSSIPSSVTGSVSLQGKTVNDEGSAAVEASIPVGKVAMNIDMNGRTSSDFSTPEGIVDNSSIRNTHNTAGISYIGNKGYVGGSASYYYSEYGIPPDPLGGHPSGVDIEMRKLQFDLRGERTFNNSFFRLAEARYSFVNYNHVELESSGSVGTEFGNLTANASAKIHNRKWGIFSGGSAGIWGEWQDYAIFGARTPDSNQYSGAAYIIQEGDAGPLHFELGTRFEYVISKPKEERISNQIGAIEERSFSALATSASAIYGFTNQLFVGSTFMHSFRAPTLEELYSEGPHLAAYSYEIGNPELDAERGIGLELFFRYRSNRFTAELAGYRNDFQNYLYARDTGEQSLTDPSLNNYQFVGESALFLGTEFSADFQLTDQLSVGGTLSYTRAERNVSEEEQQITGYSGDTRPLPMIPPLQGSVYSRFSKNNFTATVRYKMSDEQTRLGEFETETEGYGLLSATLQYRFSTSGILHTVSLSGSNLLDRTYRDHLSRIKEVFPAPGRNLNLLYRLYF